MSHHSDTPQEEPTFSDLMKKFNHRMQTHDSRLNKLLAKEATEDNLGETGDFPDDKIKDDDKGGLKIGLTVKDGRVVLNFGKNLSWIGFTREEAITLGRAMLAHAEMIFPATAVPPDI